MNPSSHLSKLVQEPDHYKKLLHHNLQCQHQWFEIKKIGKPSKKLQHLINIENERCEKWNRENPGSFSISSGISLTDLQGILLKCANCLQEKELWEEEKS